MSKGDRKTTVLIVLDGWGYREETRDNAIALGQHSGVGSAVAAGTPHPDLRLRPGCGPARRPDGQLRGGPHEPGLGPGDLPEYHAHRPGHRDGSFDRNPAYCSAIDKAIAAAGAVHIFGLLSPGGVHSHEQQIFAAIRLAAKRGAQQVYLHAFLDGRDTPPRSAGASLETGRGPVRGTGLRPDRHHYRPLLRHGQGQPLGSHRASLRAADRRQPVTAPTPPLAGLQAAYDRDENDEFVLPTVIRAEGEPAAVVADNDSMLFMNFRSDRARQLTRAFIEPGFDHFARRVVPRLSDFVMTTEYAADIDTSCAFAPAEPAATSWATTSPNAA